MKTLPQLIELIQLLFAAGGSKAERSRELPVAKTSAQLSGQAAGPPERHAFAEDDSPPGHKIQWRH